MWLSSRDCGYPEAKNASHGSHILKIYYRNIHLYFSAMIHDTEIVVEVYIWTQVALF